MVPLVAIPLIFLGIAIYAIGLGLTSMLPHVHCGRVTRFAISGVLFLLALPVGMWCMSQGSRIPIIVLAYGYDEYAAGLWIIIAVTLLQQNLIPFRYQNYTVEHPGFYVGRYQTIYSGFES